MANFSLVIVPAKVLTGGKHKVRVMVSHNGQTRYIPTDIIIDSISEFKEGRVVKRPDKDILNLRLKKICDKYNINPKLIINEQDFYNPGLTNFKRYKDKDSNLIK